MNKKLKYKKNFIKRICAIIIIFVYSMILIYCHHNPSDFSKLLTFSGNSSDSPKIIGSSPSNGEKNLPGSQKINILFDRPMNINSCIQAFSISPPTRGATEINSDLGFSFTPNEPWTPGSYTYSINKSCEDKSGKDINNLISNNFTIGNTDNSGTSPALISIEVYAGTLNECASGNGRLSNFILNSISDACAGNPSGNKIILTFSREMDRTSTVASISINPNISSSYAWDNTGTKLAIASDSVLANNQRYTIIVSGNAQDIQKLKISSPAVSSFSVGNSIQNIYVSSVTVPAEDFLNCNSGLGANASILENSNILNACYGNPNISPIKIDFNFQMDPIITQSSISINPAINGIFAWTNGNKTLVFTPDSILIPNQRYNITIGSAAKTSNHIGIGNPVTGSFIVGDGSGKIVASVKIPVGTNLICSSGLGEYSDILLNPNITNSCAGNPNISPVIFEFNVPMNPNITQSAIRFNPNINGVFSWSNGNKTLTFSPDNGFSNKERYGITIESSARTSNLISLGNSVIGSFMTGDIENKFVSSIKVPIGTLMDCNSGQGVYSDILVNTNIQNACIVNKNIYQIIIDFNYPMEPGLTQSSFSINPPINGTFAWTNGNMTLSFTPDSALIPNQRYNIVIGSSAKTSNHISIETATTGSFLTGSIDGKIVASIKAPVGTLSNCNSGLGVYSNILINPNIDNSCSGNPNVSPVIFEFNVPMNPDSAQSAISFSPNISGTRVWTNGNTVLTFTPDSKMTYGTRYTVSINSSAKTGSNISIGTNIVASFIAGKQITYPSVQAIGLASQGCSIQFPGIGSAGGGNWNLGSCWWDNSLSILNPANYQFRAGDTGSGSSGSSADCADANTDNFRIIFNSYMNMSSVITALDLRRISPPFTTIRLSSWLWHDCQSEFPFGCRVLDLAYSEQESSCNGVLFGNASVGGDFNLMRTDNMPPGIPLYSISVNSTAEDTNGIKLYPAFNFTMEGK